MRHREGASIKCLTGAKAVFRLEGKLRRWYPTPAIAASWDPKWREVVYVDCKDLNSGPDMNYKGKPPCDTSIRCKGNRHAVFRVVGNEIRHYPSGAIASSWDLHWTRAPRFDCSKLKRGPNMRHRNGASIKCNGDKHTVFRLWGNEMRGYPNPLIASSWDSKWPEYVELDCRGIKRGPNMRHRNGASIQCHGNKRSVFRLWGKERRLYPNAAIASSWDSKWRQFVQMDCRGIKQGPQMRHRNGASIRCNGKGGAVFRLWGNERRWYPNSAIAASWDSKWAQFIQLDCRHIKQGPQMRHRNGASIKCNGDKHTVFRLWGNEMRAYPNPPIAASWDSKWFQFIQLDCRRFKRGPNMRHRNGASIKCNGNNRAVYRLWGNERRVYPNSAIASSWDSKWRQFIQLDCRRIKQGPHMRHRNGASIRCNGNNGSIFRLWENERRLYPNPSIASSWDSKWAQFIQMDCRHIKQGPHMRHRNGATIRCNGNNGSVFRLWENERRLYPNPPIAASWDSKWRQFVQMDCRHIKQGPHMRHRNGASIKCNGDKHTVFRLWGNERRAYPNPTVAASWDSKWFQFIQLDCRRFMRKPNMRHRNGASIRCNGKGGAIFRLWGNEIRWYPNPAIASSWDSKWAQFIQLDCRRFRTEYETPRRFSYQMQWK